MFFNPFTSKGFAKGIAKAHWRKHYHWIKLRANIMKTIGIVILPFLCILFYKEVMAENYKSSMYNYAVTYGEAWKQVKGPESSIDVMLVCASNLCEKNSNITIGVRYDPKFSGGFVDKFLKATDGNGKIITRDIQQNPSVKNFRILREGRTMLGSSQAYEVIMEYSSAIGASILQRTRHTFMTFDKGNTYNVSFHSDPEHYEKDFVLVRKVLATFAIIK